MHKNKEKAIAKALGRTIAKKRAKKGLTQECVAEKLNIGNEAISRIERGAAIPNIIRLVELAEIFECGIDELLVESSQRPLDNANHFHKLFEKLSEADKNFLLEIMSALAQKLFKDNSSSTC